MTQEFIPGKWYPIKHIPMNVWVIVRIPDSRVAVLGERYVAVNFTEINDTCPATHFMLIPQCGDAQ
jgi:hypothetical protein